MSYEWDADDDRKAQRDTDLIVGCGVIVFLAALIVALWAALT